VLTIVCECADPDCAQRIELRPGSSSPQDTLNPRSRKSSHVPSGSSSSGRSASDARSQPASTARAQATATHRDRPRGRSSHTSGARRHAPCDRGPLSRRLERHEVENLGSQRFSTGPGRRLGRSRQRLQWCRGCARGRGR
jgi:hypothetical protein